MRPTKTSFSLKAFSLIELLVALSILAIVAAIIVPRFLNVRENAVEVMVRSQADTFQHAFDSWLSLGGTITPETAYTSGDQSLLTASAFLKLVMATPSAPGSARVKTASNAALGADVTATDSAGVYGSSSIGLTGALSGIPQPGQLYALGGKILNPPMRKRELFASFAMPPLNPPSIAGGGSSAGLYITTGGEGDICWYLDGMGRYWAIFLEGEPPLFTLKRVDNTSEYHSYDKIINCRGVQ